MEETRNSVAESSQRRCPYCGEKIGLDHVFCPYCGESLTQRRDEPVMQQHVEPAVNTQIVEPQNTIAQNPVEPVESKPASQSEEWNLGAMALGVVVPVVPIAYYSIISGGKGLGIVLFCSISIILSTIALCKKHSDALATVALFVSIVCIISLL